MAKYFVINIYAIINFQNFYYLYEFYHNFLKLYLTLKLTYTTKEKKINIPQLWTMYCALFFTGKI